MVITSLAPGNFGGQERKSQTDCNMVLLVKPRIMCLLGSLRNLESLNPKSHCYLNPVKVKRESGRVIITIK